MSKEDTMNKLIVRAVLDPGPDASGKRKPWSREKQKLAKHLRWK